MAKNGARAAFLGAVSFAAGLAVLGGCYGEEPWPPPIPPPPVAEPVPPPAPQARADAPPTPTLDDLIAKTRQGMKDAFDAHDAEKFASFLADDVRVGWADTPGAQGRDGVVAGLKALFGALPDVKSTEVRTFAKGNVRVVESVLAATMTGDFMGIKATKKPVGDRRLAIFWFNDDGLVSEWHPYADLAGMMAQMKGAKDAPTVARVPTEPVVEHTSSAGADDDKLPDWFKTLNDAFNQGSAKAALDDLAPEGDATFYFRGGKSFGRKELAALDATFAVAFPKPQFVVDHAWGIDGFVVAERTVKAPRASRPGSPSSSGDAGVHIAEVVLPADGKIEHTWVYAALGDVAASAPPRVAKGAGSPTASDAGDVHGASPANGSAHASK